VSAPALATDLAALRLGADGVRLGDTCAPLADPAALGRFLYRVLHVRAAPAPHDPAVAARLRARLRAHDRSRGCRDPGWTVARVVKRDCLLVTKGRLFPVYARRADFVGPPRRGGAGDLRVPALWTGMSPGAWMVNGRRGLGPGPLTRLYCNVRPEGAADLVDAWGRGLDARRVPFRLKVCLPEEDLARSDAVVLYLPTRRLRAATGPVADGLRAVHVHLRAPTSSFALPVRPGVAVAEELASGTESFGQARARALAACLAALLPPAGAPEVTAADALPAAATRPDWLARPWAASGAAPALERWAAELAPAIA
jgi:hypothetical protein